MGKKGDRRIKYADEQIVLYATKIKEGRTGGLQYRTYLYKISDWICIRRGLQQLKDEGEL